MSPLTSSAREHFRETLAAVAEKAKAALPQAINGRVEKAVALVLQGDVEPQENGSITVYSATDATRRYVLQGTSCTCADFERKQAPGGWCAHRIAAGLHKRVREVLGAETPQPTRGEARSPLGEAPASINLKILMHGHEVMITLRDFDETALLGRLEALLRRSDVRPLPKPAPRQQWRKRT